MGQYSKYPDKGTFESTDFISGKTKIGSLVHFTYAAIVDFVETIVNSSKADAYSNTNLTATDKSNLSNEANWSSKYYVGPLIEGGAVGTMYYDADYVYNFMDTHVPVRYSRV